MPKPWIDLRSDTVTQPTPGMRRAIAEAVVGDDIFGEDPTVNALEQRLCELTGKPAAVFACSGTQSNQLALWAHCRPGDEVLIELGGHIAHWEGGAPAVIAGVTVRGIPGERGLIDLPHLEAAPPRPNDQHYPQTRLLCLENTANLGGGTTYPLEQLQRVADWARQRGLLVHLDGARLFNACVARGYSLREICAPLDSISLCFSKGLGCPMGSMLVGSDETIARARRGRKILGGALRQAGMMAAAAAYALDHHVARLADDHTLARTFASGLQELPGLACDPATIETNIVYVDVAPELGTAQAVAERLKAEGVGVLALSRQRFRAVTHLDITATDIQAAIAICRRLFG